MQGETTPQVQPPQDQPAAPPPRPKMTAKELSLHVARAGLAARAQADAEASDPHATAAMRDAASPRVRLPGGMVLGRLSFGALWLLRDAGSIFAVGAEAGQVVDAQEVGLAMYVLADPLGAHILLQQQGKAQLWAMGTMLAYDVPAATGHAAMGHINREFAALNAAMEPADEAEEEEATGKKPSGQPAGQA